MLRPLLAQGLALSFSTLGCSTSPAPAEAYGKAVVTMNGEVLVLDTGDDGKLPVPRFDDSWHVGCSLLDGEAHLELVDHSKDRQGFYYLDLHLLSSERRDGDAAAVNMRIYVDDELFDGSCPATLRTSRKETHECDLFFAGCNLHRLDRLGGAQDVIPAHLELASFHLSGCFARRED
ncbi:hypothetical protein SOCEGT47_065710 [Sorangium cellulosum]|jgi:hypothetical protein|uniref:Uncharacterized protein n=1 Tax=Sorangium cellulosum TaxID=56 RepID=A0A4P2Q9V3_SORCE|nr:hypothetical protein [Sorangium cellulosum]AUX26018.1 hypothetical protein SOCEGT47_065710 [Sorangium cellulosum]